MIYTLLASDFWNGLVEILKNEWLGIIASAFILVSFLFSKQIITRIINMVGCVIFVVYGLLLPTYSTAFMNGALFIVHIVFIVKDYLARKKNAGKSETGSDEQANADAAVDAQSEQNTKVVEVDKKVD